MRILSASAYRSGSRYSGVPSTLRYEQPLLRSFSVEKGAPIASSIISAASARVRRNSRFLCLILAANCRASAFNLST